jgi:hypothetical protein
MWNFTPTTTAATALEIPGPLHGCNAHSGSGIRTSTVQHYVDSRPIAFAEMTEALKGLLWFIRTQLHQPTTITFITD